MAEEVADAPLDVSVEDATTDADDEDATDAVADASIDAADADDGDVGNDGDATDDGDAAEDLADVATDPVEEDVIVEDAVSEPIVVGCASGTFDLDYGTNMQLCGGGFDQCSAEFLCAAGWHLCTYTEFVSRGGALVDPPSTQMYWIAGSIRDNCGEFTAPVDRTVLQCSDTLGFNQEFVTWDCTTGNPIDRSNHCDIGLATSASRWKLQGQTLCVPFHPQYSFRSLGAACCL